MAIPVIAAALSFIARTAGAGARNALMGISAARAGRPSLAARASAGIRDMRTESGEVIYNTITNNNQSFNNVQQLPPAEHRSQIGQEIPASLRRLATAITGGVVGLGVAYVNLSQQMAEAQSQRQRYLSNYNGDIAYSFAELEVSRIGRNINTGAATSKSTKWMNQNLDELENAMVPYQAAATNLWNAAMAKNAEGATTLVGVMDQLTIGFSSLVDYAMGGGGATPKAVQAYLDAMRDSTEGIKNSAMNQLIESNNAEIARRRQGRQAVPPRNKP